MNRRKLLKLGASAGALVILTGASPLIGATVARAAKAEIYTGLVRGTAVGGYDPVAYFDNGKPVRGNESITAPHAGAIWRFSSEANRDAFLANPAKYAPQYGGYCAWAVANGYTAKGDPRAWRIVDGRLYLNYSKGVQRRWERDIPGNISKGNQNWPDVLN